MIFVPLSLQFTTRVFVHVPHVFEHTPYASTCRRYVFAGGGGGGAGVASHALFLNAHVPLLLHQFFHAQNRFDVVSQVLLY